MRLRIVAVVLTAVAAVGHVADMLPALSSTPRAHGCSCPIKGPCCTQDVCPMEAAKKAAEGVSFGSCGEQPQAAKFPELRRWTASFRSPADVSAAIAREAAFPRFEPHTAAGVRPRVDRPPRPSFL